VNVAIDGIKVRYLLDVHRLLSKHRPGDTVLIGVRRGSSLATLRVKTYADPNNPKRAVVGIVVEQAASIKLPFPISIDTGNIGGPSAGLAFALDLVDQLGRDIDRGYKVAVTGELSLDGAVQPIGAVKQKTIGARRSHVDVFLVPAGDNAREAGRYAGSLRIVAVHSFRQALQALSTLPPHPLPTK
jgi:PDZ domain-containing protein